jgi:general secretion pathway protein H
MPTSATGTLISKPLHQRGFTLVEILVVMVIIGVLAAGALLSLGTLGQDRQLDTERDRLLTLLDVVREQAGMQSNEYGLRCFAGGYEFVVYQPRAGLWQRITDDRTLRRRHLPDGLLLSLVVDGRAVVLPKEGAKEAAPQVLLYSSGELNPFELTLRRDGVPGGFRIAAGGDEDRLEAVALPAGAT